MNFILCNFKDRFSEHVTIPDGSTSAAAAAAAADKCVSV